MTHPMPTPHLPTAEAATPCATPAHTQRPPQPVVGLCLNDAELRAVAGGPAIQNGSL